MSSMDLGLPKSGIPRICSTQKHIYQAPFGRLIKASNVYGDKSGRLEPFLWARIQNHSMSLSGKQAAVLYGKVEKYLHRGPAYCPVKGDSIT